MILVVLLSLPFLFFLARKPILRRMALRHAVRRPRETALVILGTLLGTAIMTGSFVVGDTFAASIRQGAYQQLGPVDEVVSLSGTGTAIAAAQQRLLALKNPDVDGLLALTLTPAAIATTGPDRVAAPRSQLLETDFAAARGFGRAPGSTGISGPTPGPGEAAIGHDLASTLHARVGTELEAFAYDNSVRLKVVRVLPKKGVAGLQRQDLTSSNNAFVAPGTIATLVAGGRASAGTPPQTLVLVSNRGSVEGGAHLTDQVTAAVDTQLGSAPHSVDGVKETVLERADRTGKSLSRLYTSLGSFAVLAGILLLVNIFFMLADERKSELGMLRAVGMKRASLIGGFATEGWCYALFASLAGTFVGLLLGRALIAAASALFSSGSRDDRVTLHFAFKWASVQRGLVIGFVIAVVTVVGTSIWLSRFNIIQAIRDITEPARRRPRLRVSAFGMLLAVFGVLLTGLGAGTASFLALMLGPVFVLLGLNPVLARWMHREVATTVSSLAVLVWSVAAVPVVIALGGDIDIFLFVVQGLVLVGAAVVLVAQHQSAIGHAIGTLAGGSLRVRLGLAYPLARKFRTSMTLGMFALVVFVLVMVSVFAAMFSGQVTSFTRDASGGFNVVVDSNPSDPVSFTALAAQPGVRAVAPLVTAPIQVVAAPGLTQSRMWDYSAYDSTFVEHGAPKLDDHGSYASDRAAYAAVLADPSLAIVDKLFLASGGGPPRSAVKIGDQFSVVDPVSGARHTFKVAALSPNDFANNGVFVGMPAARLLAGSRAVPSRAYVDTADPNGFVARFAGQYLPNGGQAETIQHDVQTELAQQQQFFLLMRTYLALGLIVGVAGIGVIMVRAVRERRRQVGVLRALGFQAKSVRAAFVVESAFVAVEGVLIGTVLALVCAWSITLTDAFGDDISFRVPWVGIGILVVGTLICALLATAAPARSAAKIDPAVALRIAD